MDELGTHTDFIQIGFADKIGQAVWIDRYDREHHDDLSGEEFIQRALLGRNALSNTLHDEVAGMDVQYYAAPIYDRKAASVEGAVFAAFPQDELRSHINHSLYAGQGLVHIITNQGDYIVKSDSPLVIGTGNNIFELSTPLNPKAEQEIRENLTAQKTGYLIENFCGENRLIAYAPLDINDWNVFYAVPEDFVSSGAKTVKAWAIAVICVATGIFIFFITMIYTMNNKNRRALEYLAFVDPVTGHRNFQKFLLDAEEIRERANDERYAVVYVDIKDFRYINDVFGREVGDRMLRYLASYQDSISQEGEVTARMGEDAFVSLRKCQSKRDIERRFEGTLQHLALFPETYSRGFKAELYGGAYLLNPAGETLALNDMLDRAIAAQESVKYSEDEKRFAIYSNELRKQKLWNTEVESRMEAALENGEFKVYLQPKIDIQHGDCISGAEALVRWVWPDKGLISPGCFIGLFEKNGFIVDLDRFVFDCVCRFYKETVLGSGRPLYIISVNVSRIGLMRPDFIKTYTEIRDSYRIPAGCIELELTESLILGDYKLFEKIVRECKRNGFLCSIDDFGAGYSSLNVLKSIYVDVLKLDRQFFLYGQDADRGQKLVENIIAMAKALNIKTVAEGIEEKAMVEQLRAMGCDAIQGYVYAKPMSMEEFARFVDSWTAEGDGEEQCV